MKNRNSYERLKRIQTSLSELSKSLDEQYCKMRQECMDEIIEDRKEYVTKKNKMYSLYEKISESDSMRMTQLNRTLASVAQQVQNRDESKWLFDFDVDDREMTANFLSDINHFSGIKLIDMKCHKTPHGYAIVVPHGFDTRKLMEKWKGYDITLKKDGLLFLDMITNK